MMDIVIPVLKSKYNYIDLRYALRSIEKHLKGYRDIYIIGDKIPLFKNLKYIRATDDRSSKFKERNIYRKIIKACNEPSISEDFLFMNDDHFLLTDFEIEKFPYYHKGELADSMAKNTGNYRKTLNHTKKLLAEKNLPTLNFDTHCQIVFNKQLFFNTFTHTNWDLHYGYGIKSLYCGMNGIEGIYQPDCKINNKTNTEMLAKIAGREWFSTGAISRGMVEIFDTLYPQPCSYEN